MDTVAPLPPMDERCRAESERALTFPFTGEHACRMRRDTPHDWHVCACGYPWPNTSP